MSSEVKLYEQGRHGMRPDGNGSWVARGDYAALHAERDAALAQLAAIQGGMGEVVGFDRNAAYAACPESGCDWGSFYVGWKAAAAQHQRITAAMAAEVERLTLLVDVGAKLHLDAAYGEIDLLEKERDALRAELEENDGVIAVWRGRLQRAEAELAAVKGREAVAWVNPKFLSSNDLLIYASHQQLSKEQVPLYTTPPASPDVEGLVKALERIAEKCSDPDTTDALDTALSTWRQAQEGKP